MNTLPESLILLDTFLAFRNMLLDFFVENFVTSEMQVSALAKNPMDPEVKTLELG
tara:strand:+ start:1344 stop:1508 length:165 start_codon:yes stop_codon:yes gene_type:complete